MEYTLPERNALIEQLVQLEIDLGLNHTPVVNMSTKNIEEECGRLSAQLDLTNTCKQCRNCGC